MNRMEAYFSAQPWEGGRNVLDFVRESVDTFPGGRLRIAVAWAKTSGINALAADIARIRAEGGRVELIAGLSAGGATRQGLERALEVFDTVHVVFDMLGPTFHPKVYLYEATSGRRLLVGSNNLTAGGLFLNSEAALELHESDEVASKPFEAANGWMEELLQDSAMTPLVGLRRARAACRRESTSHR